MILNSCYSHRGGGILIPNLGDTVRIGDVDYLVVHIDEANKHMYFAKKYWEEDVKFGNSMKDNTYNGSVIYEKCKLWYTNKMLEEIKPLLVTLDCGYGCPIFIPTLAQVSGTTLNGFYNGSCEWDYSTDDESRKFKSALNPATSYGRSWWLQSKNPNNSSRELYVGDSGMIDSAEFMDCPEGFLPCFAMDISIYYKVAILAQLFGS